MQRLDADRLVARANREVDGAVRLHDEFPVEGAAGFDRLQCVRLRVVLHGHVGGVGPGVGEPGVRLAETAVGQDLVAGCWREAVAVDLVVGERGGTAADLDLQGLVLGDGDARRPLLVRRNGAGVVGDAVDEHGDRVVVGRAVVDRDGGRLGLAGRLDRGGRGQRDEDTREHGDGLFGVGTVAAGEDVAGPLDRGRRRHRQREDGGDGQKAGQQEPDRTVGAGVRVGVCRHFVSPRCGVPRTQ